MLQIMIPTTRAGISITGCMDGREQSQTALVTSSPFFTLTSNLEMKLHSVMHYSPPATGSVSHSRVSLHYLGVSGPEIQFLVNPSESVIVQMFLCLLSQMLLKCDLKINGRVLTTLRMIVLSSEINPLSNKIYC